MNFLIVFVPNDLNCLAAIWGREGEREREGGREGEREKERVSLWKSYTCVLQFIMVISRINVCASVCGFP